MCQKCSNDIGSSEARIFWDLQHHGGYSEEFEERIVFCTVTVAVKRKAGVSGSFGTTSICGDGTEALEWPSTLLQRHPFDEAADVLSVSEAVKSYVLRAGVLIVSPAGSRVTYTDDRPVTPSTPAPIAASPCPNNTATTVISATTVIIMLLIMAACIVGALLFWVYAMPRIRFFRARRDSSLPLVVQY
ncbi:hypothetical protein PR048_030906 [Dryococelus australis]|uniref:Uncharacterized protein n=1 Tax=Dryococelus australis TaxID=614101 RepID=A0ABQ9GAB5_9NEOP|nr:hypothetical protein PR048_030906 [Dryococelus australis]